MKSICFFVLLSFHVVSSLYSTKTHYYDSFTKEQLDFMNNEANYAIENCTVEQLYIVLRHGSRYPSDKQANRSIKFLNDLKKHSRNTSFVEEFLNSIDGSTFENKPHYGLTDLGASEMRQIAERFRRRYANFFGELTLNDVSFMSSSKDRSIESGTNFTYTFFSGQKYIKETELLESLKIDDDMLRGFDKCKVYVKQIKENLGAYREYDLFKEAKIVRDMVIAFRERNFIDQAFDVDVEDLFVVGTICDIEYAHRMPDNWCKLLTDNDRKILGYFNDLKNYWIKSYGSKINSFATCYIIQDLVSELEKFMNDDANRKKVLLRFGHAENIFPLISNLDLFKDEQPLRSDNYNEAKRLFRTEIIAPFSSNVATVLLKCGSQYKVKLLINELPVGVINAGNLTCVNRDEANSRPKAVHYSICNQSDFKEKLLTDNQMCFKPDFCELLGKEEL